MDDVLPPWESIGLPDGVTVTIVRAAAPTRTETYTTDGEVRTVPRVRADRACAASWQGTALVLDCQANGDGPGVPVPIVTHEVRQVTPDGHLALDVTWTSGGQTVVRHATYHRQTGDL